MNTKNTNQILRRRQSESSVGASGADFQGEWWLEARAEVWRHWSCPHLHRDTSWVILIQPGEKQNNRTKCAWGMLSQRQGRGLRRLHRPQTYLDDKQESLCDRRGRDVNHHPRTSSSIVCDSHTVVYVGREAEQREELGNRKTSRVSQLKNGGQDVLYTADTLKNSDIRLIILHDEWYRFCLLKQQYPAVITLIHCETYKFCF